MSNNYDEPASPCPSDGVRGVGMTKLEFVATMICSRSKWEWPKDAIEQAKALLDALESDRAERLSAKKPAKKGGKA